jgi:hypothetical protein
VDNDEVAGWFLLTKCEGVQPYAQSVREIQRQCVLEAYPEFPIEGKLNSIDRDPCFCPCRQYQPVVEILKTILLVLSLHAEKCPCPLTTSSLRILGVQYTCTTSFFALTSSTELIRTRNIKVKSLSNMKFLLVAALAGSAAAFSPAASVKQSSTVANAFANGMVGGEGPEPMPFSTSQTSVNFDPVGFAEVRILIALELY